MLYVIRSKQRYLFIVQLNWNKNLKYPIIINLKFIMMRYLILSFLFMFIINVSVTAQDSGKSKAEIKKEKKAAKKALRDSTRMAEISRVNALIAGKKWTLETDILYGKRGQVFNVNSTFNFISIQDEGGIIQLSLSSLAGWNGVGGVTVEGRVTKYDIINPKKEGDPVSLRATIMSSISSADVYLKVMTGGRAEITISGNWGERITFSGKLVHSSESRVYKGRPSY